MSTAVPPAPPPGLAQLGATASTVLTVAASDGGAAEAALANLSTGAVLDATLSATGARNLVQVTTAGGTVLDLKLPPGMQLPGGADLTLQLIQQNGQPAFKLLAINGRQLGPGGLPTPGHGGGGPLATPSALPDLFSGRTGAAPQPGAVGWKSAVTMGGPAMAGALSPSPGALAGGPFGMVATVLRPGPAGGAPVAAGPSDPRAGAVATGLAAGGALPAALTGLTPGTQLSVRIAGITPPMGQATAAMAAQPSGAAASAPTAAAPLPSPSFPVQAMPTGPAAPAIPAAAAATPAAIAPRPAMPVQAETAAPAAVPSSPAPVSAAGPPVPLAGTVLSHTPGGGALLQTPAGLLALPSGPPLPVGSGVQLDVLPPLPPSAGSATPPPPPQGLQDGAGWPTLTATVEALAQADRQMAEQVMRTIPQSGPRLAAAMSMFAGAVRSGEFKLLAGDGAVKGLDKAGRRDLADRLKKDFLALTEEAERPRGGGGDWRVIVMPFAHGAEIDPIRLFVRRPCADEDKGGRQGDEQRFILEVEMTRLGRIQFDGLIMRDAKRFDLIVRTSQPLGAEMCRDIAGIFAECGQLTGIKGGVSFQSGRPFVELPPTDASGTRLTV